MSNEKQAVAASSMAASAFMTTVKFVVGLSTGSLGILSEALHSLLDFGATLLTFLAVRASDKPPDRTHPYGHGKIESIAALVETALLFATSLWVLYEAVLRLAAHETSVVVTWSSVGVMALSIAIDVSRARALKRVAEKTRSEALAADALHFSSDILSSSVVLIGLGIVALGWPKGDAVAAIGVSLFVCRAGWVMGRRTIDTLIDTAPLGAVERVEAILARVEGVAGVTRVRVRPAGSLFFVDAEIAVARGLSQKRLMEVRARVQEAIRAEMAEAEVTVTTHPLALDSETVHERVAIIAANHGANAHHVTSHREGETLFVGLDLEMDGMLSLEKAHRIASLLEDEIRGEFGASTEVETHIEPVEDVAAGRGELDSGDMTALARVMERESQEGLVRGIHKIRGRHTSLGLVVTFHCRMPPDKTVAEVHDAVDAYEKRIRAAFPGIWRLVAHAEPDPAQEARK